MPSRASVSTSSASAWSRNSATSEAETVSSSRLRFEPLQPECCQHQQPRNKRSEQPRHKGEVNTPKVSAGSRIVTGPTLPTVRPSQYAGIRDRGRDFGRKTAAAKPARRASSRKWDNETRVGLVRRARRMNRTLAQAFPHVYCELDFTNPAGTDGGDHSVGAEHRQAGQPDHAGVVQALPHRAGLCAGRPHRTRRAHPAHRLLPQQGQLADPASARSWSSGSTARCPTPWTSW